MTSPDSASPDAFSLRTERQFEAALSTIAIPSGSSIVTGVSGGPDSSALLLLLGRLISSAGYRLEAAYFDHGIREPEERAAELAAVERLASAAGVRLHRDAAAVPLRAAESGHSLEEEARIHRYGFLSRVAANLGAGFVAVGHTRDDQAETILLHILRGSGIRGLVGMIPTAPWPMGEGPRLIRPLLALTRAETAAYCRVRGFEPHRDSSNASTAYRRNQLRLTIMPLLREINPRLDEALVRLGSAASEDTDLLDGLADLLPAQAVDSGGGTLSLGLGALRSAPTALRKEALARAYSQLHGSRQGLAARHLVALADLVDGPPGRFASLPAGIVVERTPDALRFAIERSGAVPSRETSSISETALQVPGLTHVAGWRFAATIVAAGAPFPLSTSSACVDVRDAGARFTVRSRRTGDRMEPAGMHGRKKLQDLFVDARVPRLRRGTVPVICADGEVIWVVGLRRGQRADVRTSDSLRIGLRADRLDATPEPELGWQ